MDYTQQGFCDLKENSEKNRVTYLEALKDLEKNLQNNMFTQYYCGAKSEPPFWVSHFLKSFDVFVCEHHSFQLLRCIEKTNKQTETKQKQQNKTTTKHQTKQNKTKTLLLYWKLIY